MTPKEIVDKLLDENFVHRWTNKLLGRSQPEPQSDEPFLVELPPGAIVHKHDETGIDIEASFSPHERKWFFQLRTDGFVYVKKALGSKSKYSLLVDYWEKDQNGAWHHFEFPSNYDPAWRKTQKPANLPPLSPSPRQLEHCGHCPEDRPGDVTEAECPRCGGSGVLLRRRLGGLVHFRCQKCKKEFSEKYKPKENPA